MENKNHFFKKITFNNDFRCYKSGDTLDFKAGINLIVGEQGCGKSTLFYSIINHTESGISADVDGGYFSFLDTEKMNPRLQDSFKSHREFEDVKSYDIAEFEHAKNKLVYEYDEKSHGQVMLPLLLANKKLKNQTLFVDEPEAGLSIRSQYKVLEHYKELSKNNQLIIATHSPILIKEIGEVLSLEHKQWMSADDFINSQLPVK